MKSPLSFLAAFAAFSVHAADPSIREGSVEMTQGPSSRQVVIKYELQDAPAIVTVDILTNGVSIGSAHLTHFAGDVHRIIEPGGVKRMTWRPDKAWPGHEISDGSVTAKVTAWALNAPPDIMVVDLVVPNQLAFYADVGSLPGKGGVTNELYKTEKMVFRKCPAANVTWRMGAPSSEPGWSNRQVARLVSLSNDFYMGVYELTQRQFERITGRASFASTRSEVNYGVLPMESLSWAQMRMNMNGQVDSGYDWPDQGHAVGPDSVLGRLRELTGHRLRFDLPTEAQWEFACRAGCGAGLYTGKEITVLTGECPNVAEIACYAGNNDGKPSPVGSYRPNDWGFYDMIGNVMEFCLDYWCQDLTGVDPETGSLSVSGSRSRRGAWYADEPRNSRCAYRIEYGTVTLADYMSGFRIAAVAELAE